MYENKQLLATKGYGYIHTPGRVDYRDLAVVFMKLKRSDEYTRSHKIEGAEARTALGERIKKELIEIVASMHGQGLHTAIISSEHLHSRIKQVELLHNLKSFLKEIFGGIIIVAYIRDQRKKFASSYSTQIKTGSTSGFRKAFNMYLLSKNDYFSMSIPMWENVFGKEALRLQIFDSKYFYRNDLIQDFLYISGSQLDTESVNLNYSGVNKSLSKYGCIILRMANLILPRYSLRGIAIRERLIKVLEYLPGKPWSLSKEQAELIKLKYRDSNEELRKKYFPQKESLFDD